MLIVKNLNIVYKNKKVVNDISFAVNNQEVLGIVGESGSGKSQTVLSILGLNDRNAKITGSIKFLGKELVGLKSKEFNKVRGNTLSIIFQDPMTSLNPYLTIQTQMTEVLRQHRGYSQVEALKESIRMLDLVKIAQANQKIKLYPHEFSGGMQQRVMIAMALLCKPKLLIADEPTTALDVTVQAQVLQILKELKNEFNMSVVIITHDMGVVANICDRVNVMYAGNLIESATTQDIFYNTQHPYTKALLASIPSLDKDVEYLTTIDGDPVNSSTTGCSFQNRCKFVYDRCRSHDIVIQQHNNHYVKCNLEN